MLLKVNSLNKYFDGLMALYDVSFEVKEGELTSVIGPNGAGKSTLFNVLTGYLKKDHGEVIFNGEDITDLAPYEICRKGLGRSFQKINIFLGLTVFDNIQVSVICGEGKGLRFFKPYSQLSRGEAFEIIENVGLENQCNRLARELPYGDQRRLEIAIALTNKPKLLLLDEPTAGLPPNETKEIVKLIRSLVENHGISILIVEHDMDIVFSVSEKIRVLHQGRIIAEGTPDEIRANREVQRIYLGEEKYI